MNSRNEEQDLAALWREAYAKGDHAGIVPRLRLAVAEDAGDAGLHYMLGCSLLALGQAAEAVAALGEAARLEPASQEAQFQLGVALQAAGRRGEALGRYREALRLHVRGEALPGALARQGPRVPVPRTTLCCVDCRNHELALSALRRSMAQCAFERVVFFTDRRVDQPGIEVVVIPDIASIGDYSRFMAKALGGYIESDFALVVQYDGYVLNGRRWEAAFQNYDYVGAPWGRASGVGNGGFSLRSRRLLQALRDPRIAELVPEDIAICETYRDLLEGEYGLRFAPPAVAARFSFETLPPPAPTLGFHGLTHLVRIVDMDETELAGYKPAPMTTYVQS
ncbi:MAG TPA: DUF5672 family protein [Burkholderiales bacterium]|nr:DUF5672 family protein [Burkholderiales bacterium]